ncbi:hypothetical protein EQG41_19720 [Billgrantia azerbaijanica]|nr:hypothetical protein EQG41_19720 [Halomonas azerbaijanica]
MNQQQRDRWASELLTQTLGIAWHESSPQARRVADAAADRVAQLTHERDTHEQARTALEETVAQQQAELAVAGRQLRLMRGG